MRNSNRNSGWVTTKAATGEDFTTTEHYALRRTASWWRKGAVFPPQPTSGILNYAAPQYLPTSSREGRRARAQRHNPQSIATLRIKIARFLVQHLPCCPLCCRLRV